MRKKAKLLEKLNSGKIDGRELRTLLTQCNWQLERKKGSHEVWIHNDKTFVLATHSKELKMYQIKQAQQLLLKIGEQ